VESTVEQRMRATVYLDSPYKSELDKALLFFLTFDEFNHKRFPISKQFLDDLGPLDSILFFDGVEKRRYESF
jgi:hypothetical protein